MQQPKIIFCVLLVSLVTLARAEPPTNPIYNAGNQKFAMELFQEVLRTEPGNLLVSPVSLQMVMSVAAIGARGPTQLEALDVLKLPPNEQIVVRTLNYIISTLKGNENFALNLANGLFVSDQFRINETFRSLVQRGFGAQVQTLDFQQREQSSNAINNWVAQKTNNKIKELVSPNELLPESRLFLLNAIHFKGNWLKPFDQYDTILRPFHLDNGAVENVHMMQITDSFDYYDNGEYQLLSMPYEGGEASMVFILPRKGRSLQNVQLQNLISAPFTQQLVRVQIPRFSIETTVQFKPILEKMGMRHIFSRAADLSGIGSDLIVDKVVQKTFINVTEKGTEAAAATAGGVVTLSIPAPDHRVKSEFIADRPFLVVLHLINSPNARRAQHPEYILFTGRIASP
ncbi:PREDICTED: serpin I2-like [Nicrophorus vespilloides]|uniref:Serpin I2-like n=1 Tax=Nicrophorus vespilloides TaxID=110193 RepID=A0ABM1NCV7_NICVS|nr:PREDICTED: serpin I2-like [Nicrophorus vespilloides]